MGLFGSKKNEVLPKVSDIFSAGDLQKIKDTLGQKSATGSYGKYGDMAKTLLQVVEAPQRIIQIGNGTVLSLLPAQ